MQGKKCKRKLCLLGSLTVHLFPTAQMFENESPFSCYSIQPVLALEQVRSSGTRIDLGRKISPFLFWELPLPHSTKKGLNTWGQPGLQTLNIGLVEEINLSLCGGDTPPLGKKDTLDGVQGGRKV